MTGLEMFRFRYLPGINKTFILVEDKN